MIVSVDTLPETRLPVFATVEAILRTAWREKGRFTRVAGFAFIFNLLVAWASIWAPGWANLHPWTYALMRTLANLAYVPAATALIRDVVWPDGTAPLRWAWGPRETLYLLRGAQLFLLVALAAAIVGAAVGLLLGLPKVGGLLREWPRLFVALVYAPAIVAAFAFYALTIPAAAVGDDSSLSRAADLSRGHRGAIIAIGLWLEPVIIALSVALGVVRAPGNLTFVPFAREGVTTATMTGSVMAVTSVLGVFFITLLHATALGVIYRSLRGAVPA